MKENTRCDPIMEKSQIAWVELVIRKFNQLRMEEEDYYRMRQVEKTFDKILLYIFLQTYFSSIFFTLLSICFTACIN